MSTVSTPDGTEEMQSLRTAASGQILIRIPYARIFITSVMLALGSITISTIIGYALHFKGMTATQCGPRNHKVPNVIPSISAVTGGFTPEKYVWRLGMAFFSSPRIFDSFLMYNFFAASSAAKQTCYCILNKINWFSYVAENLSLFILTYISSTENYPVHEKAFISFAVFAVIHMFLTCYLFRQSRPKPWDSNEKYSWRLRLWSMIIFLSMFIIGPYFFIRHTHYCEPYVYSAFCFCEYIMVFSNVSFHCAQFFDLRGSCLTVSLPLTAKYY